MWIWLKYPGGSVIHILFAALWINPAPHALPGAPQLEVDPISDWWRKQGYNVQVLPSPASQQQRSRCFPGVFWCWDLCKKLGKQKHQKFTKLVKGWVPTGRWKVDYQLSRGSLPRNSLSRYIHMFHIYIYIYALIFHFPTYLEPGV